MLQILQMSCAITGNEHIILETLSCPVLACQLRNERQCLRVQDASKASLALCKAEGVDILPAAGLQAARKAPHKRKKKQIADPST